MRKQTKKRVAQCVTIASCSAFLTGFTSSLNTSSLFQDDIFSNSLMTNMDSNMNSNFFTNIFDDNLSSVGLLGTNNTNTNQYTDILNMALNFANTDTITAFENYIDSASGTDVLEQIFEAYAGDASEIVANTQTAVEENNLAFDEMALWDFIVQANTLEVDESGFDETAHGDISGQMDEMELWEFIIEANTANQNQETESTEEEPIEEELIEEELIEEEPIEEELIEEEPIEEESTDTTITFVPEPTPEPTIIKQDIPIWIDGELMVSDVLPVNIDDRVLVPFRSIFEMLNCEVMWDDKLKTVFATTQKGDTIHFAIGKEMIYHNGKEHYTMPVPATIVEDRTMVPIRAVAEALGVEVLWVEDDDAPKIVITSSQTFDLEKTITVTDGVFRASYQEGEQTFLTAQIRFIESMITDTIEEDIVESMEAICERYYQKARAEYDILTKKNEKFEPYVIQADWIITTSQDPYLSLVLDGTVKVSEEQTHKLMESKVYQKTPEKILTIEDIFPDLTTGELHTFLVQGFSEIISKDPLLFYTAADLLLEFYSNNIHFYLTSQGVVFYIVPETIANHEAGIIAFEVLYDYH